MTASAKTALRLAALLESEIGLRTTPERLEWVAAAAQRAGQGIDGLIAALSDPEQRASALQRLIDEVTVKESFFFRQTAQLDTIDWARLLRAARAAGRDDVRVWSAACSTGDEAYTLAMMGARSFGGTEPPVVVLGTDVSAAAVRHARVGRYARRAVRHVPVDAFERWLRPDGRQFVVAPELRRIARFSRHNLLDATGPPGEAPFDLVVCRNVLIYFGEQALERAVGALESSLAPHGLLILGAADRLALSARTVKSRGRRSGVPRKVPRPPREARRARARQSLQMKPSRESDARDGNRDAMVPLVDDRDLEGALLAARATLERDPRDAEAQFLAGMLELASGDAGAAVASLRRALYVEPSWALAAFQLGRAYDGLGDDAAARRAYRQTLASLDPDDERAERLLGGLDIADVAAACRHRLRR